MKRIKPIASQEEANHVRLWLVNTAVTTLDITPEQANKRIDALFASGKLKGLHPDSTLFKMITDKYMQTPVE
jgi:hypothetical protein